MLKNTKLSMLAAIVLLMLAFINCATPEYITQRRHDFQPGLSSWKYTYNGTLKQEAKFKYNDVGDLIAIEIYASGRPYGIWSYLNYITVKDEFGDETRYRVCSRRVHYNETSGKVDWQDSTSVVVINNNVLIETLVTRDGKGNYKYVDRYEYDELGRKTMMSRSIFNTTGTTIVKEEFNYEGEFILGVSPKIYYFEIPYVYYNINDYIFWCTVADETYSLE